MVIVIIGRRKVPESTMRFVFDDEEEAYRFYLEARENYAENDLYCVMEDVDAVPGFDWEPDYDECQARWE